MYDRVSDDVLSLSHLLLLDRGIGSAGDVIFKRAHGWLTGVASYDVGGLLLLDGGVGAIIGLVFREEFAHNAAAEERGVVDALALGSGGVRAGRVCSSLEGVLVAVVLVLTSYAVRIKKTMTP